MKVGIHLFKDRNQDSFILKYKKILDFNGITNDILDINNYDFWEKVRTLDIFIFRWSQWDDHHQMAKAILPVVEQYLKIKCFPDYKTSWHYDDKIKEFFLLQTHDYPIIKSWVFWNKSNALKWLQTATFPLIFKLKGGAGSSSVIKVNSKRQAMSLNNKMFGNGFKTKHLNVPGSLTYGIIRTMKRKANRFLRGFQGKVINPYWQTHKNYILFQKFLPGNDYDTRVTVIGDRAFAYRRFNRKGDFRSSGSGIIDYDISKIDIKFIELALSISKKMSFQSMAYDFLYDENNDPAICEISYTFVDIYIFNCLGYWNKELNFHNGHFWPQYFHLVDLLNNQGLKHPNL